MAPTLELRRVRLGGALGDVAEVRHSVGGWLRDWDLDVLADDVALVTTELVTNAILHAGGDVDVVLERCGPGVRVRVHDGRPDVVPSRRALPSLDDMGDDDLEQLARSVFEGTTTGRGLVVVDAFSDAWGVDLVSSGKEVWAELGTGRSGQAEPVQGAEKVASSGSPVCLRSVPVRLILLSALNLDDLVRELQTTDFDAAAATNLAAIGEQLVQETQDQREPLRAAARAALQDRSRRIDVELSVPPERVAALRRFVSLTGQVEELCCLGVLLSEPPSGEVTAFRRWFVDEVARQVGGEPADRCPFPD